MKFRAATGFGLEINVRMGLFASKNVGSDPTSNYCPN